VFGKWKLRELGTISVEDGLFIVMRKMTQLKYEIESKLTKRIKVQR
jgi:hypothetical protein